jgi:hypothetical protein
MDLSVSAVNTWRAISLNEEGSRSIPRLDSERSGISDVNKNVLGSAGRDFVLAPK